MIKNMDINKYEYCCMCEEETGKAGKGDDSLYLDDGDGPFCDTCYTLLIGCWVSLGGQSHEKTRKKRML